MTYPSEAQATMAFMQEFKTDTGTAKHYIRNGMVSARIDGLLPEDDDFFEEAYLYAATRFERLRNLEKCA